MTDLDHLTELLGKATQNNTFPLCPDWFYTVIRHGQRNMDIDVSEGFFEPDRQCGAKLAAALNAIPEITALIAELAAARKELAVLRKRAAPQWFYLGDDQSSDRCRHSIGECIEEDWSYDNAMVEGHHVVQISCATSLPDIWCHLHILSEDEKDARGDDDPFLISEYATEADALASLPPKDQADA